MSKAQKETFANPKNKGQRKTDEELILNHLKETKQYFEGGSFSIIELSLSMGWAYSRVQPRVSELNSKGRLLEAGIRRGKGRRISLYRLNVNPAMFGDPKKTKYQIFKEATKRLVDPSVYEVIEEEFDRLRNRYKNQGIHEG